MTNSELWRCQLSKDTVTVDHECAVLCVVTQSCPTLCDLTDCSPSGSSVHGGSPGKKTGVACHSLLQGIFPIQGSNSGLQRCRWILYHLNQQGSPRILEWVAYPFSPPDLGVEPGSPTVQADSLPAELPRKPLNYKYDSIIYFFSASVSSSIVGGAQHMGLLKGVNEIVQVKAFRRVLGVCPACHNSCSLLLLLNK